MKLTPAELARMIDADSNGIVTAGEFKLVASSLGFTDKEQINRIAEFLLPRGELPVGEFE